MSAKSELKRIEDRLGGDLMVITAIEQFDNLGFFEVHGVDEDLGLLTREEVLERFERDGVKLIFMMYVDDWRGEER